MQVDLHVLSEFRTKSFLQVVQVLTEPAQVPHWALQGRHFEVESS